MAAEGETSVVAGVTIEAGPAADQGVTSIGADYPARADNLLSEQDAIGVQSCHGSLPEKRNAEGFRPFDHQAVQDSAAHADAAVGGKIRFGAQAAAYETNATKGSGIFFRNENSQLRECRPAIRHQAFAAWFVDGRPRAVGYRHCETALTGGDSGCQSGRPAANYENVCLFIH